MSSIPLKINLYLSTNEKIKDSPPWLKAIFKGFWLGILSRRELQTIDRIYYEQMSDYCDANFNKSGFFDWERRAFLKFFQSCQTLLVAAIGGGRETIALNQIGFDVDGFECNQQLFEFAERLFEQENVSGEFHLTAPDTVWQFGKIYDGAIVGWAAYMHIHTRARRIDFLKKMRVQISTGAPLMVSFFARGFDYVGSRDDVYFRRICLIGNFLRALLFRERIEFGDGLEDTTAHWFDEREIKTEFAAAGFELIFYSAQEYGHAVGRAA